MQLADYERYIVENNFVESSKSGYFAAWVQKFLKLNIAERLSNNDKIRQFRDYLDVDENLKKFTRDTLLITFLKNFIYFLC